MAEPIHLPPTCPRFLLPYFKKLREIEARVNILSNPQGDSMIQSKVTDIHKIGMRNGWQATSLTIISSGVLQQSILPVQAPTVGGQPL